MKPTDEMINQQAHDYIESNHPDCLGTLIEQVLMYEKLHEIYVSGAKWAISQMQPEWVAWDIIKSDKELRQKFNDYNDELIMLQFDDGSIKRYDEDYNRAKIISVLFLPQPPTK